MAASTWTLHLMHKIKKTRETLEVGISNLFKKCYHEKSYVKVLQINKGQLLEKWAITCKDMALSIYDTVERCSSMSGGVKIVATIFRTNLSMSTNVQDVLTQGPAISSFIFQRIFVHMHMQIHSLNHCSLTTKN